jgi:hypothetical protein
MTETPNVPFPVSSLSWDPLCAAEFLYVWIRIIFQPPVKVPSFFLLLLMFLPQKLPLVSGIKLQLRVCHLFYFFCVKNNNPGYRAKYLIIQLNCINTVVKQAI